jgi:hypothetical protein
MFYIWQNEIGVTDQAIIDSLLEDLGNIFTSSVKKTFGTFNCKNIDRKINKVVRGHLKTIYYFLEYQSQKIIL